MTSTTVYKELRAEFRRLRTKFDVLERAIEDLEDANVDDLDGVINKVEKAGIAFSEAVVAAGSAKAEFEKTQKKF